jgi:hypothetical protein
VPPSDLRTGDSIESTDAPVSTDTTTDTTTETLVERRAPRIARFAVAMALAGCLVGAGWSCTLHQSEQGPSDVVIERLTPPPAAQTVPGQTPVVIDLAYGYTMELTINGKPVPASQISEEPSTAVFSFTPGPGKFTDRFENGPHIAQIVYWPKEGSKAENAELYQWTFTVV